MGFIDACEIKQLKVVNDIMVSDAYPKLINSLNAKNTTDNPFREDERAS